MKEQLEIIDWVYDNNIDRYHKIIKGEKYKLWHLLNRIGISDSFGNVYCIYPCKNIEEFNKIIEDITPFLDKNKL